MRMIEAMSVLIVKNLSRGRKVVGLKTPSGEEIGIEITAERAAQWQALLGPHAEGARSENRNV